MAATATSLSHTVVLASGSGARDLRKSASAPSQARPCLKSGGSWTTKRRSERGLSCRAEAAESGSGEGFDVEKELERVLQNEESKALLDRLAERVMQDDESKELLEDLAAATERVAKAQREKDLLEKRERELEEVGMQLARVIAEQNAADALIAEVENDVREAEEAMRAAEIALITARAGATVEVLANNVEFEEVDKNMDRIESGKAAAVSAIAGTLASLPFLLISGDELGIGPLLSVGGVIASAALYGVTYRYILRRDLNNVHLKSGAAAAFTLVRGIGEVDAVQLQVGFPAQGVDKVLMAALNASESLFIFGFATLAMDYCLREALLMPYPSKKSKVS